MSWKKKILTPERFGEKFFQDKNHPYPTPSQTSSGHVSHLGGEGRNGFDTFVNVIHQQNGWRAIMMWWVSRPKFCIKRLKIRRWKTQMERESSKECSVSFLWTNESFSLWNCRSMNSTLFSTRRIGALGLFWTNQGSEVSENTWGTFRTLWSKKSSFVKRNFCIYKGFMDVFYILTSEWKKKHKMCIWDCFFTMCSTDLTCLNATI